MGTKGRCEKSIQFSPVNDRSCAFLVKQRAASLCLYNGIWGSQGMDEPSGALDPRRHRIL
jgi:hypothetical protein